MLLLLFIPFKKVTAIFDTLPLEFYQTTRRALADQ
jgi:hypothetical protein